MHNSNNNIVAKIDTISCVRSFLIYEKYIRLILELKTNLSVLIIDY